MPEPTIDQMLDWLDFVSGETYEGVPDEARAIRAILEQHRAYIGQGEWELHMKHVELAAIRAFVERVEKRARPNAVGPGYKLAMQQELDALESDR